MPASSKLDRAAAESSRSVSIDVSTPSFGIPAKSQRPLTPEPVPISTTDFACACFAAKCSNPPTAGDGSNAPDSTPNALACCINISSRT